MGLDLDRDRLCVVQLSPGDGSADVVQIPPHADARSRPNLKRLLADKNLLKIFHFARFDLGMLCKAFGVMPEPVYCTKIASRLTRTYTDKHGLKDLVREVLGQDLSKQQQSVRLGRRRARPKRRWPTPPPTSPTCMRSRTGSMPCWRARAAKQLAAACFRFLPDRVRLDLAGFAADDIFAHS